MDMSNDVLVSINPKRFRDGLRSVKRLHGTYNPTEKTWRIPASMAEFLGPQNPGLVRLQGAPAAQADRCPYYTADQGCPLHGETCPSAR